MLADVMKIKNGFSQILCTMQQPQLTSWKSCINISKPVLTFETGINMFGIIDTELLDHQKHISQTIILDAEWSTSSEVVLNEEIILWNKNTD